MRRFLPLLALLVLAVPLAGCVSANKDGLQIVRPATLTDVNDLRADMDKADAAIREDATKAEAAGKAAYDAAIAAGKTAAEAEMAKYQAVVMQAGADSATAKATAEAAEKAAKEKQGGDFPVLPAGGAGAAGLALLYWLLRAKAKKDDDAPFVGANGQTATEADLVAAALAAKPKV